MFNFTDKNDKDIVYIRGQLIKNFINGVERSNERFGKEGQDDKIYHFNKSNKIDDLYMIYLQAFIRSVGSIGENGLDYLITGKYKYIANSESSLVGFIFLGNGVKMICYDYQNWLPNFCQKPENFEYMTITTEDFYLDKLTEKEEQKITSNIIGKSKVKYNNVSKDYFDQLLKIKPVTMDRKTGEFKMYDLKNFLISLGVNNLYIKDESGGSMIDMLYPLDEIEKIEYCIIDQMVIVCISNFVKYENKLHIYGFSIYDFLQFLDTTSVQFNEGVNILFFPTTLSNESGVCFEMNYTEKENIVSLSEGVFKGIQMGWVKTAGNPHCKIETYDWCKHLDYLFYMRFFFLEKFLNYKGPILLTDLSRVEYDDNITSLYLFRNFNGNKSIYSKYGFEEIYI